MSIGYCKRFIFSARGVARNVIRVYQSLRDLRRHYGNPVIEWQTTVFVLS
jgi:hypothetical protein